MRQTPLEVCRYPKVCVKMIKSPPFIGSSQVLDFNTDDIFDQVDKGILFRGRWKMNHGGEDMLKDLLEDDRIMTYMKPQAVYGYIPCYRKKHALVVNNDAVWEFPELKDVRLSQYFNTQDEGGDIIPLTAVTIGGKLVQLAKDMYENNDYAEYFLLYGLAAEMTEAIAELVNQRINNELKLKGLRRSFGYPACPDLSYQNKLLEYVGAQRINLSLSGSNQLIPEFSTTALIIHR